VEEKKRARDKANQKPNKWTQILGMRKEPSKSAVFKQGLTPSETRELGQERGLGTEGGESIDKRRNIETYGGSKDSLQKLQ